MRIVVGLHGPNGSGKSHIAGRLAERWGFQRVGTGTPIKDAAFRHFYATLKADLWGRIGREPTEADVRAALWETKTPVSLALLQDLGMYRRREDGDFWLRQWQAEIRDGRVVDENLRFPNECHAIRALGGWLVKVERPGVVGGHETERALDDWMDWNCVLRNDGSLADLVAKTDHLAATLLAGENT